ncbi:MAG: hypothetical protein ACTSRZ_09320 [Promethearchaeota archaeon]
MSENEDSNNTLNEEEVNKERKKLKELGLDKMSESSFNVLFDENLKNKRKPKEDKKEFIGFK